MTGPAAGVRVAVVGTGSIGRRHLGTLLALGASDLVAVSEHTRRTHLEVGDADVTVRHRLDDVLGEVDLVVVATPTAVHRDQAAAAVAAGCHVLVEKPVGASSAGLDEVAASAEVQGLVAAAAHQFRFEPGLVRLRELVRAGALGTLLTVEGHQGEHLADYHPGEDYRTGYAARRDLGGGVLRTQVHHLDHLEWTFGPFERVYAVGGQRTDLEVDVEDTVTCLFRAADGTPVQGHLDYRQRPKVVSLVVAGTEARAAWDHYGGRLVIAPTAPGAEPEVHLALRPRRHVPGAGRGRPGGDPYGCRAPHAAARRHPGRAPGRGDRALARHRRGRCRLVLVAPSVTESGPVV